MFSSGRATDPSSTAWDGSHSYHLHTTRNASCTSPSGAASIVRLYVPPFDGHNLGPSTAHLTQQGLGSSSGPSGTQMAVQSAGLTCPSVASSVPAQSVGMP